MSILKQLGYLPKGGGTIGGTISWNYNGEPSGNINITVNTSSGKHSIRLVYRSKGWNGSTDEWVDRDYQHSLERQPCHYGGFRWFFRCQLSRNGVYCGRRVRVLYLVSGYFGCRHCADLTYESCNQSGRYKGFVSAVDLDEQLEKVRRTHYRGKLTRKYRKLLKMEERFDRTLRSMYLSLKGIK